MSTRTKAEMAAIVKDSIKELFKDEDFISRITQKITDKIEQKLKKLEEEIKNQNDKVNILQQKMDDMEQQMKANNICIYGVPENSDENITSKILQIVNSHTGMVIKNEIINCYRIGKQPIPNKSRPIIMKLRSPEVKSEIFRNVNKFRGKGIFITEDLTYKKRMLLKQAKSTLGEKEVWSSNGQIFTKTDGKRVKLCCFEDVQKYKRPI